MTLTDCKSCGAPPRSNAAACEYCGRVYNTRQRQGLAARDTSLALQDQAIRQQIETMPGGFWTSAMMAGMATLLIHKRW